MTEPAGATSPAPAAQAPARPALDPPQAAAALPPETVSRAHALADRIVTAASAGEQALRVEVDWSDQGVSRLHVALEGGTARVHLDCATSEALARARDLEAPIRERLEACGLQLADFTTGRDDRAPREAPRAWQPPLRDSERPYVPAPARQSRVISAPQSASGQLDVLV